MLKEKNSLLTLKIKNKKTAIYKIIRNVYESLYSLYYSILEHPFENIWYECIIIILSYLQLISLMFDETVSIIK